MPKKQSTAQVAAERRQARNRRTGKGKSPFLKRTEQRLKEANVEVKTLVQAGASLDRVRRARKVAEKHAKRVKELRVAGRR